MRFLLVLSCFCAANSMAMGQQADSSKPSPQKQTTPQVTPQTAPQRTAPPQTATPQTLRPQTAPPQTAPPRTAPLQTAPLQTAPPVDDLSLDANRSFDFGDSDNSPYSRVSDPQSSIASNSEFRGASPQMMGDFGGGSTILNIGNILSTGSSNPLTVQIPFAGGSRRIKAAENNQVQPLNRVYGTFNYFDNAIVSAGARDNGQGVPVGGPVHSKGLSQYTLGVEKTFFENFSIDVRMPLVGNLDYTAISGDPMNLFSQANVSTNGVGNLSTSIKALLLQMGQTSISGGLQFSIPTGSSTEITAESFSNGNLVETTDVFVDNDALHLMPFIGVYREFGRSSWLQAFTQVDVPTSGNDVRVVGDIINIDGRLNEQTLLYADISLGKWLYRNPSNSYRSGRRGITGIASLLELHYTGSLNDADTLLTNGNPSPENRLDVLNLTTGLQVEFSERWRINTSGVVPLRKREFEANGDRREDRFFDGELSLHINRFF